MYEIWLTRDAQKFYQDADDPLVRRLISAMGKIFYADLWDLRSAAVPRSYGQPGNGQKRQK